MNFKKTFIHTLIVVSAVGLAIQIALSDFFCFKTMGCLFALILLVFACGRIEDKQEESNR